MNKRFDLVSLHTNASSSCLQSCPQCGSQDSSRCGSYHRSSDNTTIHRRLCRRCRKTYSEATADPCFRQKTRHLNRDIFHDYCSAYSQRRMALAYQLNRKTVVRKLLFLAQTAKTRILAHNNTLPPAKVVEFDDLETFEHTKCKPLSILLMVEEKTRRILDIDVAKMPAKGLLAAISRKKYGLRPDERSSVRRELLRRVQPLLEPNVIIKSDMNPSYPQDVKEQFPQATHVVFKGRKGCVTGQGELKKISFDPIFTINHTCAMFRANINRLVRKTWCTTKRPDRLLCHLWLYVAYHNLFILSNPTR